VTLNEEAFDDPFYSIQIAPGEYVWMQMFPAQKRLQAFLAKEFLKVAQMKTTT
jgi:hypothetical protein